MKCRHAAVVLSLIALPSLASAAPTEVWLRGAEGQLQAWLWKPDGPGPFPALVYNHGSERDPRAGTDGDVGPWFAARGWVVLFPYRRGCGKSEGHYWRERVDAASFFKRDQAAVDALVTENDDVAAAVAWLRAQPFVDGKRVAVAGCSFGGIQSLLAAERPLALHAVVDFAGGAMSWAHSAPLRERMLRAAENARAPILFVQAENDFDTTPSRVLADAMQRKGLPHRVRIFPPHGASHREGHGQFCMHGSAEWGPDVLDFLTNRR